MGDELLNKVEELRVIPVVTLPNAECAKPLADALREGGIACAEITFRTASAEAGLRALGGEDDFHAGVRGNAFQAFPLAAQNRYLNAFSG